MRRPGDPPGPRSDGSCAATADSWRMIRRPVAAPPAWTIRRALCPPSSPSDSRPRRSASKLTPSRCQILDGGRRLACQHLGRRQSDRVATGRERVLQVELGAVLRGQRRRQSALRPVARGAGQRRRRDERDSRARADGAECRVEAGRARTDDDHLRARGRGHSSGYGTGDVAAPAVPVASPPRWSTTPVGIRSGSRGSRRSAPSWSGATGSATNACSSPGVQRDVLERVHPARYVDGAGALRGGRRRPARRRHGDVARLVRGRDARVRRRRRARLAAVCVGRAAASASAPTGRQGTTRSRNDRWASACSTRGGRRDPRARAVSGSSGC